MFGSGWLHKETCNTGPKLICWSSPYKMSDTCYHDDNDIQCYLPRKRVCLDLILKRKPQITLNG